MPCSTLANNKLTEKKEKSRASKCICARTHVRTHTQMHTHARSAGTHARTRLHTHTSLHSYISAIEMEEQEGKRYVFMGGTAVIQE